MIEWLRNKWRLKRYDGLKSKLLRKSNSDFHRISGLTRDLLYQLPVCPEVHVDLPATESTSYNLDNLIRYLGIVWIPAGESEYEIQSVHLEESDNILIIRFYRSLNETAISLSSERRVSIIREDTDLYRCWQYEKYDAPFGLEGSEGKWIKPTLLRR